MAIRVSEWKWLTIVCFFSWNEIIYKWYLNGFGKKKCHISTLPCYECVGTHEKTSYKNKSGVIHHVLKVVRGGKRRYFICAFLPSGRGVYKQADSLEIGFLLLNLLEMAVLFRLSKVGKSYIRFPVFEVTWVETWNSSVAAFRGTVLPFFSYPCTPDHTFLG